jgi:hypothetical protein
MPKVEIIREDGSLLQIVDTDTTVLREHRMTDSPDSGIQSFLQNQSFAEQNYGKPRVPALGTNIRSLRKDCWKKWMKKPRASPSRPQH